MSLARRSNNNTLGGVRNNSLFRNSFFDDFHSNFDQLFNKFFTDGDLFSQSSGYPKLDSWVDEKEKKWKVRLAVPGVSKENLTVEIKPIELSTNGLDSEYYIKISGSMSQEYKDTDNNSYVIKELHKSKFSRELPIPGFVNSKDKDPIAELKDGLLTLSWEIKDQAQIPKEVPKTKLIEIK